MDRFSLLLGMACLAAGCSARPGVNVLDVDLKGQVVFATTNCEVGNPDGQRCDKKTCKADSQSDCTAFAGGCIKYGNHYSGTAQEGTCSRVL